MVRSPGGPDVTAPSKRSRARRRGRSALGAGMTLAALGLWPPAASFAVGSPPGPGVSPVGSPGVALHVPADGRLNGDGFTCDVPGYRLGAQLGQGASAVQADPGEVLVLFELTCTSGGQPDANLMASSPTLALVAGGQAQAVPADPSNLSDRAYYLAEVPSSARSVLLQAKGADGYTQSFSFSLGHRVGAQPAALYASANDWQVTDAVGSSSVLPTPDPGNYVKHAAVDVAISSATLSYFSPTGKAAPRVDEAWLVLHGSAEPVEPAGGDGFFDTLAYQGTLRPGDFTLDLGPHRTMTAKLAGRGGPDDEGGQGLFGGTYYFGPVPASTGHAVVHIFVPSPLPAKDRMLFNAVQVPVKSQPAPVTLSFPVPYVPGPLPAHDPAPFASSASSVVPGGSSVLVVALVVVLALAGATYLWLRRARALPVLGNLARSAEAKRTQAASAWLATAVPAVRPAGGGAPLRADVPEPPPAPSPGPAAPARDVLVPLPVSAPVPAPGEVWFCVLGAPEVAPSLEVELSQPELEIGCFLACRAGRPWSGEALRAAIGAGRAEEWSARTVVTYVNGLRRKLGAEHVPDATSGGGYRLVGAATDFAIFETLVTLSAGEERAQAAGHLASALALVRGVPFKVSANYGWADRPDDGVALSSHMSAAVVDASLGLARLAIAAGDGALATWAVAKGVMLEQTNVALAEVQLDAAALGERGSLDRAWADITARFGANRRGVPEELAAYLQRG